MKPRADKIKIFVYSSFLMCILLCAVMIYHLWGKLDSSEGYDTMLWNYSPHFIGLSGVLAILFLVVLISLGINLKKNKLEAAKSLEKTTQKMHHFRTIADLLYRSNIWPKGLREYIDKEYPNLSYFEIKEFYKGKSKTAIDFLQEPHYFGETENLFLELKSLLLIHPKEKYIPEIITYPVCYSPEIVKKWIEHKIGSGLYYVFGYKYGAYKDFLHLDSVFERHQEKILSLAHSIDPDKFEGYSFNDLFLSKIWEHLTKEIIPSLAHNKGFLEQGMTTFMQYLYACFFVFVFFGILLPALYLMLSLGPLALIVSFSVVIFSLLYVLLTFYLFLSGEVNR
ncbi:MAG: hypothetical protein WBA61_16690 [Aequorivita sp.]